MTCNLKIHHNSKIIQLSAEAGANLLAFLKRNNFDVYSPCSGNGTCGKCRVKLSGPCVPAPTAKERKVLGEKAVSEGFRLSCLATVKEGMEIHLSVKFIQAKVLTEGKQKKLVSSPLVAKKHIILPPPNLNDQRSDSIRLAEVLSLKKEPVSLDLLRQLPETMRKENFNITLLFNGKKLAGIEEGDTTARLYGVAFDIGTTTIAAYLMNMLTGERLATYSCLNPQRKFGADVISRIKHTIENSAGLDEMNAVIVSTINDAVKYLTGSSGLKASDIHELVFVGNTTMMHFLLKIPARSIAAAPFIPAATQALTLKAAELGIAANRNAVAAVIPSVSAYIGADTVSAVLASEMDQKKEISLLIDFGTNGEIVLGNSKWLFACSAAAGPAFEGANIRHGVGGIRGAIDSFTVAGGINYTTIGGDKPIGICGSGLVDIVSELYKAGIIDETGRLDATDTIGAKDKTLACRLSEKNGAASFTITFADEAANQEEIFITQKDVRELQNAKAAIAAGISILAEQAGIRLDDIGKVYLAGGFGTYMNTDSALNIGLIPSKLRDRIESIGNAAGTGAIEMLVSGHSLKRAGHIKNKINYIELSAHKKFSDFFVDALMFPE